MQKIYKSAPFPFTGQKRMFAKHYIEILEKNIPNEGEGWTIVDVFGGSGLLSHIAKSIKPKARVIYNDFDNYSEQLNHIDEINQLRELMYEKLKHIPYKTRLDEKNKKEVIQIIERFKGYKSLNIIASWLLFSGKQVDSFEQLYKQVFFNSVRKSDYPQAGDYLKGIEITSRSFELLLSEFKEKQNTLFILDPPYLATDQKSYKQENYFNIVQFLELVENIRPPFIFFSSTKSEILDFIQWAVENKKYNYRNLMNLNLIQRDYVLNKHVTYQDNLFYKFH